MNKQLAILTVILLVFLHGGVSAQDVGDKQSAPEKTEKANTPASDKAVEPITGAFGIPLGEQFTTSMVARVLSKQEHTYRGQGGNKLKGQLLHVEPSEPDTHFQKYSIMTTGAGIIYAIQGEYQYKVTEDQTSADEASPQGKGKGLGKPGNKKPMGLTQSTCKTAVKTMASELQARYGKPRGQGWDGLWYTFHQASDSTSRGLKLYGHRCRTGMYSIIYSDELVQRGARSAKANQPPLKGGESELKQDNPPAARPSN